MGREVILFSEPNTSSLGYADSVNILWYNRNKVFSGLLSYVSAKQHHWSSLCKLTCGKVCTTGLVGPSSYIHAYKMYIYMHGLYIGRLLSQAPAIDVKSNLCTFTGTVARSLFVFAI